MHRRHKQYYQYASARKLNRKTIKQNVICVNLSLPIHEITKRVPSQNSILAANTF